MKLIPSSLSQILLSTLSSAFNHHLSIHIMSSTGFTEFVQPTTPPKSPTPSITSVPNNTPTNDTTSHQPLPLQLAIQSLPIEEDRASTIDYQSVVEDPDSAPQGFILNELDGQHFYPIHIPNPLYRNGTMKATQSSPSTYSIMLTIHMSLGLQGGVTPSTPSLLTLVDRPGSTSP